MSVILRTFIDWVLYKKLLPTVRRGPCMVQCRNRWIYLAPDGKIWVVSPNYHETYAPLRIHLLEEGL